MSAPKPLVPADTDVRGAKAMLLDCQRLLDSGFMALSTGDEFKAAFILWCKAWLQVPAGSIPNDERILAYWIGNTGDFSIMREHVLHGFVLCDDNRLYHPVICAKALEVIEWRDERTKVAKKAASKRWENKKKPDDAKALQKHCVSNANEMQNDASITVKVNSNLKTPPPSGARALNGRAAAPDEDLENEGAALLGKRKRGLIRMMRVKFGDERVREALAAVARRQPAEPIPYFLSCCEEHKPSGPDPPAGTAEPPPPKPVNPKILGHSQPCHCPNCTRWVEQHQTASA